MGLSMASYFVTSFAAGENRGYANRFHDDLAAEVSRQLGGRRIRTHKCVEVPSAEERCTLVAETGVLVALCSPDYYADRGCGQDWAVFQRRLGHVPAQRRPGANTAQVLVRWRLVTNEPAGLPWAPRLDGDTLADYNEQGLYWVVREKWRESPAYEHAVRALATQVCESHRSAPIVLPLDDGPLPEPAFPPPSPPPGLPRPRAADPIPSPEPDPDPEQTARPRVFISYAHADDQPGHMAEVHALAEVLKSKDIDVRIDKDAAEEPQIWLDWMREELAQADYVITVASPAYRRRAEKREKPGTGLGATWEGAYLLDEVYKNPNTWVKRIIRVLVPTYDTTEHLPAFPGSASAHYYRVDPVRAGTGDLEALVRYLKRGPTRRTSA
ncbi:toll/interleukin-1 receptor domain-containing protein [Streptomyces sp. NPDC101175]|uniref:toll/interleukin-1 receptor domain-containing protein n=1 Tax=Streptomyces sp. NPDC101175 TaxID=3366123 RepID=UPI0038348D74